MGAAASVSAGVYSFLDTNGTFTTFRVPDAGTTARGVNDAGQIVGYIADSTGPTQGFLYDSEVFSPFSVPDSVSTYPFRITQTGQVVRYSTDSAGHESGFVYRDGIFDRPLVPGSITVFTYGINSNGQIVRAFIDGNWHTSIPLYSLCND